MIRKLMIGVALAGLSLGVVGCKSSHEEGVKSNLRQQWADVNANTQATTEAAKKVFTAEALKDVTGDSTAIDGKATGKQADGTVITANIKKVTDTTSQVTVTVGALGSPTRGAELAKKIKETAEAK